MKKNSRKVLAVSLFFAIFSSIVFSGTAKAAVLFPRDVISNSGGTAPCPDGGTLRPYTDMLMAQALDKPGYVFAGWTTASDGTGTLYPDQADCSNFADYSRIYAQWTQAPTSTVTFDPNGGEGSMDPQIAAGNNDLASVAFLRSFYDFAGWNTAADGSGTFYEDEETYSFASDITLYAQWVPVFTVTFDGNGGSANNMWSQTSSSSDRLRINSFTRNGYQFVGWNTAADGSGSAYANREMYDFSADITLYAQWSSTSSTSTVTFDANGGTGSMSNQTSSVSANLAANTFTYTNRIFNGWNDDANGYGTPYADGASYNFASDLTLYAQWISGSTVTFDANNGSGSMEPLTARGSVALTSNSFTRTGYDFDGWNENADGSGTSYTDGENYQFQADSLSNKLLYAQWTAHSSGTKGTLILVQDPDGQPFSSGTSPAFTVTMPQATLNSDIHFLDIGAVANGSYWRPIVDNSHCREFRWATNGNLLRCGISSITIGGVETKDSWKAAFLPLYAGVYLQWEGSAFATSTSDIVITFVSGAFTLSNVNANYLLTTKTRSWDSDIEVASVNVTVGTPPQSHSVTFDANGGQGSMSTQTASGSNELTTNSFTRSGYRFTGWNSEADGSGDSYGNGATYSFSADVTLYALWTATASSSTVTFIDVISTGMTQQMASGSTALRSNTFTRNGYTFSGWTSNADGTGTSYSDGETYSFASGMTVYAKWTIASSDSDQGESDAATVAAASAKEVEEARARAVTEAKSEVKNVLTAGKPLTVDQLLNADFVGVTLKNIDLVNTDIAKLPESQRGDIKQIEKIVLKFATVDKVAEGKSFYSSDLIAVGLIPQDSKNKSLILTSLKKLPQSSIDTFEKIQQAIASVEKVAADRKARLAALLARRR